MLMLYSHQNCTPFIRGGITSTHCALFKLMVLNCALLLWKLFVLDFLLGIPEKFPCSMSAVPVKIVIPLDDLQVLMSAGTSKYLESKLFL
jgi:hypothetical protein